MKVVDPLEYGANEKIVEAITKNVPTTNTNPLFADLCYVMNIFI